MTGKLRPAVLEDVGALTRLIETSARKLAMVDYTSAQVEAALGSAWAVDTQLIRDGTYFVIEDDDLVACGGWSFRGTFFGGDARPGREPLRLDPARDAARIRAFFVHPDRARGGLGRRLLAHCEQEARANGFRRAELVATLVGERLYRRFGYVAAERRDYPLPNGQQIAFVPMSRWLDDDRRAGGGGAEAAGRDA